MIAQAIAKESDSVTVPLLLYLTLTGSVSNCRAFMNETTCAACDCKLDSNSIKVKLRGKVVEVCCTECAEKLKEAQDSTAARDDV